MDHRTTVGASCTRCGTTETSAEEFDMSAEGPVCRACAAQEEVATLARVDHSSRLDEVILAPPKRPRKPAPLALVLALLPFVAWGSCATRMVTEDTGMVLWAVACCAAIVGLVLGILARDPWPIVVAILSPITSALLAFWVGPGFNFSRGRALRRKGIAHLPKERSSREWLTTVGPLRDAPSGVADGWRTNGATETASVAAFSHLAIELLALGAPASLVAKAHEDALDEVLHARMCYALAEAADGRATGPAAFPAARRPGDRLSFAALAADCIVESCVYESASARVADAMLRHERLEPSVRAILETIAVDEARHAEHGREIVRWCVASGGGEVLSAIRKALGTVDVAKARTPFPDDSLERFGLAGSDLWRFEVSAALADACAFVSELERTVDARDCEAATAAW